MPRKITLMIGLVALTAACGPTAKVSNPTAVRSSAVPPTTEPTPATTEPTSAPTAPASATTAPVDQAGVDQGGDEQGDVVEVGQFGLRFQLPPSMVQAPSAGTAFRAVGKNPTSLLTIEPCGTCSLEWTDREGESHVNLDIAGKPALIVQNAALDLPDSVMSNELIVADAERGFSVIMSYEGDITPVWDAFVASIEFVPIDPNATPTTLPNLGSEVITLDDIGVTFTKPEGFENDTDANLAESEFRALRYEPDVAALLVSSCPTCGRSDLEQKSTTINDLQVAGYPAFSADVEEEGVPGRFLVVAVPGNEFVVVVKGADIDTLWQPLIDSIQIAPS